ncbi:hypothetical protein [Halobacteriovorax marinus]|uniref:hypothetical protein n=1 Tax=Halobacteriovorax marinus TaxID=97084 RepID=UPI003A95920A
MNKVLTGAMILASTSIHADFLHIEVSNFTGSYKKPDGSATASKLTIPNALTSKINIELRGVEDGYILQYLDKEYHFKNPPSFINDIETGSWNNINYSTISKSLNTGLTSFHSEFAGESLQIKKFQGKCNFNRAHNESYGLQVLDACLTNSSFSISYLLSSKVNKLYDILLDLPGFEGINASEVSLSNANLNIKKNSFSFKGKVNMGISANVTIAGKSEYDIKENRVVIKVDKAKASFINIKNKLFQELEKSETETLKVDNPYIYILLK